MKVVGVLQMRMASERLPGKGLYDLAGQPVVDRIYARLGRCRLDSVILATSDAPPDDVLVQHCQSRYFKIIRGSEADLIARLTRAAEMSGADAIIRITGDEPLIPTEAVNAVADRWRASPALDYVSTVFPTRMWPDGCDVEAISRGALRRLDTRAHDREALTTYIWQQPSEFAWATIEADHNRGRRRWTLDFPEDVPLARFAYERFGDAFTFADLLRYCDCGCGQEPAIAPRTSALLGWVRGEPKPFVYRHGYRIWRREKFWSRVRLTGWADRQCWEWVGSGLGGRPGRPADSDYGRVKFRGASWLAHRLAWWLANGPIPAGHDCLHTCDNKRCVRPSHLYLGTDVDNQRDSIQRGQRRTKLSFVDVAEIRQRAAHGTTLQTLAAVYGVSPPAISLIVGGRRWRGIVDPARSDLDEPATK